MDYLSFSEARYCFRGSISVFLSRLVPGGGSCELVQTFQPYSSRMIGRWKNIVGHRTSICYSTYDTSPFPCLALVAIHRRPLPTAIPAGRLAVLYCRPYTAYYQLMASVPAHAAFFVGHPRGSANPPPPTQPAL
jgi:hypothetical protein